MKRALGILCLLVGLTVLLPPNFAAASGNYPKRGWQQITKASWYGKEFHGRLSADGTRFNAHALTAAHRSLRLGTRVKITELRSGRSVVVKITDRGPYVAGRGIDLSLAAARALGIVERGVARVRIEPVGAAKPAPIMIALAPAGSGVGPRAVVQ